MQEITVVGGGLAGLAASIEAAALGAPVRLLEARTQLGGRARSTAEPFRVNLGPHALYSDGPAWAWLRRRGLLPPTARPPLGGLRFRHRGRIVRTPPLGLVRALARRRLRAPVDLDFRSWATARFGAETAHALCGAAGVFCFDADPGRLSASFVWPRLLRVSGMPPAARYPIGGWNTLVTGLADRARELGVRIEAGVRTDRLPDAPVIVATELPDAARLLDDASIRWTGGHALCLDLGLDRRRGDPFVVSDLDEGAWIERFSATDRTLAPEATELLQAQIGIRDGEPAAAATERLESILDAAFPAWRTREVWRRRQVMTARSGALDLPGTTWRDRPAVAQRDGVFLAGDMVAAEGLLCEVSFAAAAQAARLACASAAGRPHREAAATA